jgi:hypothetical protein
VNYPKISAKWQGINNNIAAAHLRVKRLQDQGKEPRQEELMNSPALNHVWNETLCCDLVRAEDKPTQDQLSDPKSAAAVW